MRYKKFLLGVIASVLCLGLLNGCSSYSHDFNSSEEAQKYILSKLKDKYNEEFIITEVKKYKEEKIGLNWIMAEVSSKENSSQTATIYTRNTGLFEDSYHVYFYSDEIKKLAEPLCKDKNYIQKYDIEIEGRPTSTEWTGKESIEEYIEKAEYTVVLKIHLQDGKAESEYAEEISDLMQKIMQSDLNIHFLVYGNSENPIFYSLPEEHRQSDVDFILEEMYNIKSLQESMEHADEWKKQNQNNEKD